MKKRKHMTNTTTDYESLHKQNIQLCADENARRKANYEAALRDWELNVAQGAGKTNEDGTPWTAPPRPWPLNAWEAVWTKQDRESNPQIPPRINENARPWWYQPDPIPATPPAIVPGVPVIGTPFDTRYHVGPGDTAVNGQEATFVFTVSGRFRKVVAEGITGKVEYWEKIG